MRALPLILLFAASCARLNPDQHSCSPQTIVRLYFGAATPNGAVDETEWAEFVKNALTPRFPRGLTVLAGAGQWRGENGDLVREPVRIVEIIQPGSDALRLSVSAVAKEYKSRFLQDAVLELNDRAEICLY